MVNALALPNAAAAAATAVAAAAAAAAGNPEGAAGGGAVAMVTMTLENLTAAANLLPHEVGFTLATSLSVSVQEAMSLFVVAAEQPENVDLSTLMRSYADSLTPLYFLVVVAGKVEVLYGLRSCHDLLSC
jgi:predicted transcriptional regulator